MTELLKPTPSRKEWRFIRIVSRCLLGLSAVWLLLAVILTLLSPQFHWVVYVAKGCPEAPKNFTGTWRSWNGTGRLVAQDTYIGGKLNGESTTWDEAGWVASKASYRQGLLHGPWRMFYTNGSVHKDLSYFDGQRVGRWLVFYPDGRTNWESFYLRPGLPDGAVVKWAMAGERKVLRVWREGVAWDGNFYSVSNGNEMLRSYTNGALLSELNLGPVRPALRPGRPSQR